VSADYNQYRVLGTLRNETEGLKPNDMLSKHLKNSNQLCQNEGMDIG